MITQLLCYIFKPVNIIKLILSNRKYYDTITIIICVITITISITINITIIVTINITMTMTITITYYYCCFLLPALLL